MILGTKRQHHPSKQKVTELMRRKAQITADTVFLDAQQIEGGRRGGGRRRASGLTALGPGCACPSLGGRWGFGHDFKIIDNDWHNCS
jgi:hypothetical protein